MELSFREIWTVLHGMIFGGAFLLTFGGALADLNGLSRRWETRAGARENARRLRIGLWAMSALAWVTVISGTWLVYVWYRAPVPAGADLTRFPKAYLLAATATAGWHDFGMEWKEHVSWMSPLLITSAAFIAQTHGDRLGREPWLKRTVIFLVILGFSTAAVAGIFGAFINKFAATR